LRIEKTLLAAALSVAASVAVPAAAQQQNDGGQPQQQQTQQSDCHWWQFRKCDDASHVEGLPEEAPRTGTVITVDVSTNTAYLFQDGQLVTKTPAATGTGKVLRHGSKLWAFHTPRGHLKVLRKLEDPVWRKPDWAFVEAGERVPPPDSPKRYVKNHLGKYALDLGDGYMIHGTDDIDSIGRRASHGCVRLPNEPLAHIYKAARIGTDVYIFESQPVQEATGGRHSDLEMTSSAKRN
jgi:L,D-transpeptidase YbiS